jgi:hypothetical protein
MLNNFKELLQNPQLQANIKVATDKVAIIELLLTASAEKGYAFTIESINNLLAELNPTSIELSEDDLMLVNGGKPAQTKRCCTSPFNCEENGPCKP